MFNRIKQAGRTIGAAILASAAVVTSASAVFVVPPEVAEAGTNAALMGVAVLGVLVGIRAFKWIRKAL